MFEKPKKKVIVKDGKRLLIDFDQFDVPKTTDNDIVIEQEKLKEDIKKPTTKKKQPKKGKSLF
jgi:predicted Ser/Thr protein kinase